MAGEPRTATIQASSPGLADRLIHLFVVASYFAALLVFLASLFLVFEGRLWVIQLGDVSAISVGSVAVVYAFGQYRFRSGGFSESKSIVLGVLFANAFLQCYEVAYFLTFGLGALVRDPPPVPGMQVRTFMLWLVMISPIFLVLEHLRFRLVSAALLSLAGVIWVVWILYGFPQYYLTTYFFPQVLTTSDPYHLSLWLNFGSKVMMAAFFVSLLEPLKALKAALKRG